MAHVLFCLIILLASCANVKLYVRNSILIGVVGTAVFDLVDTTKKTKKKKNPFLVLK